MNIFVMCCRCCYFRGVVGNLESDVRLVWKLRKVICFDEDVGMRAFVKKIFG